MESADQQITVARRPILIRVEPATNRADLENVVEQARASGADGVELVLPPSIDAEVDSATPARDYLARLHGHANALAVSCPSTSAPVSQRWLAEVLEAALWDRLSTGRAFLMNLTIPPTTGESGPLSFARYQDALNFCYGLLRNLRHSAERCGIPIALEAGAGGNLLSPVELRELVDAVHTWAVGVCIDLLRISTFGSPLDWLETLGCKVLAVRLTPDWSHPESLAASLDHINYRGPLILSGHPLGSDLPDSIRCLAGVTGLQ
jgi:sugar phosphate isomerase/epimerase